MKRTTFLSFILGLMTVVPCLQSCLDDDTYDGENLLFAVGTVKVIEGQDYYFELDEGSLLYPTDTTAIHGYAVTDDQRAFVYFTPLDEKLSGYEYNAKLEHIENILTKDIYRMPADKADSIGHDRIDVDDIWLTEGHLNIVYKLYHGNNPEKQHMLNLVIDESLEPATDGYLHLHFRGVCLFKGLEVDLVDIPLHKALHLFHTYGPAYIRMVKLQANLKLLDQCLSV